MLLAGDRRLRAPTSATRRRQLPLPVVLLLLVLAASPTSVHADFNYVDMADLSGLTLAGTATQVGNSVNLQAGTPDPAGSAAILYVDDPVDLDNLFSLTIRLTCVMASGSGGIAILVSGTDLAGYATMLNDTTGSLGYHDAPNAFAVEIDTHRQTSWGDLPGGDQISLHHSNGGAVSAFETGATSVATAEGNLNNLADVDVVISYSFPSMQLAVGVNGDTAFTETLDLEAVFGSMLYAGVTSGAGSASNQRSTVKAFSFTTGEIVEDPGPSPDPGEPEKDPELSIAIVVIILLVIMVISTVPYVALQMTGKKEQEEDRKALEMDKRLQKKRAARKAAKERSGSGSGKSSLSKGSGKAAGAKALTAKEKEREERRAKALAAREKWKGNGGSEGKARSGSSGSSGSNGKGRERKQRKNSRPVVGRRKPGTPEEEWLRNVTQSGGVAVVHEDVPDESRVSLHSFMNEPLTFSEAENEQAVQEEIERSRPISGADEFDVIDDEQHDDAPAEAAAQVDTDGGNPDTEAEFAYDDQAPAAAGASPDVAAAAAVLEGTGGKSSKSRGSRAKERKERRAKERAASTASKSPGRGGDNSTGKRSGGSRGVAKSAAASSSTGDARKKSSGNGSTGSRGRSAGKRSRGERRRSRHIKHGSDGEAARTPPKAS